jgi:hypothetical protein
MSLKNLISLFPAQTSNDEMTNIGEIEMMLLRDTQ